MNTINPGYTSIWSRPSSVFMAASLTILVSLLIPCPAMALDVAWIFVFLIAGSVGWVCTVVKSSTDLIGLASLVSCLTLLRLALQTIAAGKILRHHPTGTLLIMVGNAIISSGILGVLLVCLLLAAIAVIIIFAACQRITTACNNYLQNILHLKQIGIATDLRMGTIDETAAGTLHRRIACEVRFFSGMNSAALLMRGEAAIGIFTLIACLTIPMTTDSTDSVSGVEHLSRIAPPAIALSVFSVIPAIIVAVSCGALMSRDVLTLRTEQSDQTVVPPQKITIITENDSEEELELINPECLNHRNVDERIVEFEPKTIKQNGPPHISVLAQEPSKPDIQTRHAVEQVPMQCKDANDYYEQLHGLVDGMHSQPRAVLLASDLPGSLPVTVPTNIAIRLAQKKQKVLLVDADSRQNAVAQVFEMDPQKIRKKIRSSCFENLFICGIPENTLGRLLEKTDLLKQFDTTLIYAPGTNGIKTENTGKAAAVHALFFADKEETAMSTPLDPSFSKCASIRLVPGIRSILKS